MTSGLVLGPVGVLITNLLSAAPTEARMSQDVIGRAEQVKRAGERETTLIIDGTVFLHASIFSAVMDPFFFQWMAN